jgi:hypothetical protein
MDRAAGIEAIRKKCAGSPVTLADVLIALDRIYPKDASHSEDVEQVFKQVSLEASELWDARRDDLTAQGDECVAFLAKYLRED